VLRALIATLTTLQEKAALSKSKARDSGDDFFSVKKDSAKKARVPAKAAAGSDEDSAGTNEHEGL
jgi:hypothetical protein